MPRKKKEVAQDVDTQEVNTSPKVNPFPGSKGFDFSLMDDKAEDFMENMRDALTSMKERRKNRPTGFATAAEIKRSVVPIRDFRMQYVLGNIGLPQETCIEIIGGEGIGKSTLLYWLMGGAVLANVPCAIQETENKPLQPDWAVRAMHTDPKIAEKMLSRIQIFKEVFSLPQFEENMIDWCKVVREKQGVPLSIPIIMGVDTWSKLMSAQEAMGFFDYGNNLNDAGKKAFKETNEGSNLTHAKYAAALCRRLPYILHKYNLILINTCHQNTKIDMSGGGGGFIPEDAKAMFNKTKIGGNAFNQNAAIQIILGSRGGVKDGDNKTIGQKIKLRVDKNSFGPRDRTMEYEIINQAHADTDGYLSPNIRFHPDFAVWMATEGHLGTVATRQRYTSDALGVVNATSEDFYSNFLSNEEVVRSLGESLNISGYCSLIDKFKQ